VIERRIRIGLDFGFECVGDRDRRYEYKNRKADEQHETSQKKLCHGLNSSVSTTTVRRKRKLNCA